MKITLLKSFLLLGAFMCLGIAKAQTVSGTVSDATGPLPGASVVVKGTTNGTQTDFDGNYTLNDVGADAVLTFSYIGFSSQEIAVNGQTTLDVVLQEDASELDEVVVVGYGTQSKRTAVGAVESVKAEEFNKGVIVNPQQLIQGKTAGVQISATNGEPGAAVNVRIRGTASVRSNNNPLYVIDGIPLSGANTSPSNNVSGDIGTTAALDPLSFLNPFDIASIDILKDASAAAIYGSRGANGVVLITTKRGSREGVLEFSSTVSLGWIQNRIELLDRQQFIQAQTTLSVDGTFDDAGGNTDAYDVIFRNSITTNYNVAYSDANEDGDYRLSIGYQDQQGEVENSEFERLTARFNATRRYFDDKLTLETRANISNIENQRPPITDNPNARGDLLSASYGFTPDRDLLESDTSAGGFGGYYQPSAERRNPLALLDLTRSTFSTLRVLVGFGATYKFTDNLSFKTNIGLDKSTSTGKSAQSRSFLSESTTNIGRAQLNGVKLTNTTWESYFSYNKGFGDDILDLTLGHSFQEFNTETTSLEGINFETTDLFLMMNNIARADDFAANSSNQIDELQSFFFRGNYSLDGKFNFSGTVRIDGSSRFGGNNKYGTFGAFGASWDLSQENWFPDVFDRFKLRAAWGVVGNQEGLGTNQFTRREQVSIGTPGGDPGSTGTVSFANDDLKWEENEQFNVGVDFGLLGNKITGSLEYYKRTTTDFLLQLQTAQPADQPFRFENIDGEIVNQGVELSLSATAIENEDFYWDINFNVGYNDNILQNYAGPDIQAGAINGPGLTGAFAQQLSNDQPLFSFYLRDWQGLDADGNNIFGDNAVQQFVGASGLPDVTLGITQNFKYKNWDLSIFFNGLFGQEIYSNDRNAFASIGNLSQGRNVFASVLPLVGVENPFNPAEVSTRFLEDGSFLRLQNVTLGHNFEISENSIFNNLRVFMNAQNLFVITDYSGQDPEVSTPRLLNNVPSLGIDLTAYPRPTTISLGINASF
ncbi:MAG: SusC/RagA family TonB-linked outer membrane protein [Flavobacteriaceae bacterium]